MRRLQIIFFLALILIGAIGAHAQAPRTYIGGGIVITKTTAEDGGKGQTFAGVDLNAAYDLRRGFQARGGIEYRRQASILNLFTGEGAFLQANSEVRYGGALVYHTPGEGSIRPFFGGGVLTTRHLFEDVSGRAGAARYSDYMYNSSVNPFFVAGAGLGKSNELSFTNYFTDTYGNTNLRGYGLDLTHTRKIAGPFHVRAGVRGKYWSYREPGYDHDQNDGEISFFVGFHFQ